MDLNKKNIENLLSEITFSDKDEKLLQNNSLINIQVFGSEVVIDLEITNPTLQYKKKVESLCIKFLQKTFNSDVNCKINFSVKKVEQENKIKGNPIPGVKNIIAVSSGKGGVGKSTISANLAVALAQLNYKVGLIDADIYGPSMPIMFDLVGEAPKAVEVDGKKKMKPLENYNVKMVSMGFFTQINQAIVWRGPMASKALNQLIWDSHWGELDYMIVDLPPGTGDIHLSLVQAIPLTGAIVVSTPQDIALADAKKGVNMFQMSSIDVPVLGLIENMAYFTPKELPENKYFIFGKSGVKDLSEKMNIEFLGEIPLVQSVREAADAGRPAVLQDDTPISLDFKNLAKKINTQIQKRNVNLPPTTKLGVTHKKGCS